MLALISDIHSNTEALGAVLEDIRAKDIKDIVCLGDVVGYGPNPVECVDMIREATRFCLQGNHDEAVTEGGGEDFRPQAKLAAEWTRSVLEPKQDADAVIKDRWQWLSQLPKVKKEGDVFFVHGSPRQPTKEYIFPRDAQSPSKMSALFNDPTVRVIFGGHTHIPGVWTRGGEFFSPDDLCNIYMVGESPVYVNVGSVGQPRDNNTHSSYVTFDGDTIVFRRVPYNHEATSAKILAIKELDEFFAKRLALGR